MKWLESPTRFQLPFGVPKLYKKSFVLDFLALEAKEVIYVASYISSIGEIFTTDSNTRTVQVHKSMTPCIKGSDWNSLESVSETLPTP